MSSKKETVTLALALLITTALLGGGIWFFTRESKFNLGGVPGDRNNTTNSTTLSTIETFAQVQNVPNGLFSYGGSTTWSTIRGQVDPAIQTVWPKFRLRYTHPSKGTPNSSAGIEMLLDNQLSFAHSSRPVNDKEYKKAQQRGFTIKEIPVAIDGRAVAVHPSLNIPGLTIAQLDDIYAGKITNWKEVGGANQKINIYAFQGEVDGKFQLVPTPTEALRKVADDPGGIFQASAPLVVPQCNVKALPLGRNYNQLVSPYKEPFIPLDQCPAKRNTINTEAFQSGEYPLTRRLVVVVKQDGQIDQQAGESYANLLLTNQGQELIEKAGFVRLR